MDELRFMSASFGDRVARMLREWEKRSPANGPPEQGYIVPPPDPVIVHNTSGEECPAFGLMEVVSKVAVGNAIAYTIRKPSTTLMPLYYLNGPKAIASNALGSAQIGPRFMALVESGSLASGDRLGPKPASWKPSKGYPTLFTVGGMFSSSATIAQGEFSPIRSLLAKPNSDIAAATGTSTVTPGSGTCKIWVDTGSGYVESSGPMTLTGYNIAPTVVTAGQLTLFVESEGRFVAGEGGETIYPRHAWALLNGALTSGTDPAPIDGISMFDGGSAPSVTAADNRLGLAGNDNDKCYIVFLTASSVALINVQHHAC